MKKLIIGIIAFAAAAGAVAAGIAAVKSKKDRGVTDGKIQDGQGQ